VRLYQQSLHSSDVVLTSSNYSDRMGSDRAAQQSFAKASELHAILKTCITFIFFLVQNPMYFILVWCIYNRKAG